MTRIFICLGYHILKETFFKQLLYYVFWEGENNLNRNTRMYTKFGWSRIFNITRSINISSSEPKKKLKIIYHVWVRLSVGLFSFLLINFRWCRSWLNPYAVRYLKVILSSDWCFRNSANLTYCITWNLIFWTFQESSDLMKSACSWIPIYIFSNGSSKSCDIASVFPFN